MCAPSELFFCWKRCRLVRSIHIKVAWACSLYNIYDDKLKSFDTIQCIDFNNLFCKCERVVLYTGTWFRKLMRALGSKRVPIIMTCLPARLTLFSYNSLSNNNSYVSYCGGNDQLIIKYHLICGQNNGRYLFKSLMHFNKCRTWSLYITMIQMYLLWWKWLFDNEESCNLCPLQWKIVKQSNHWCLSPKALFVIWKYNF